MNVSVITKKGEIAVKLDSANGKRRSKHITPPSLSPSAYCIASNRLIPRAATVKDLKSAYAKAAKKSVHRVSFKDEKGSVRLDDDSKTLAR